MIGTVRTSTRRASREKPRPWLLRPSPPHRTGVPRPAAAPIRLWLVDDTPDHHATARATLAAFPQVEFTGFEDAGEAIDEYRRLAASDEAGLPRIVLMDFFLGEWRGDAVTRELKQLQPPAAALIV